MTESSDSRIISIGGGKGGIGKSLILATIGSILSQSGKKVIYLDADLGGANLHLLLGVKYPKFNQNDFLSGNKSSLDDILLDTSVPGARLISGASDILWLANPKYAQKEKIIRALLKLSADYILIDIGAGTSYNTVDFFALSNRGIVVIDPEITTMENAYGFIKICILRKIQRLYSKEQRVEELIRRASGSREENRITNITDLLSLISSVTEDHGDKIQK
jgi:flagellar biosynthesis protein FlhG